MGEKRKAALLLCALLGGWLVRGGSLSRAESGLADSVFEQVIRTCSTPEALASFLRRQMKFQEDTRLFSEKDYWQSPEEFLSSRSGDCEDYALFAKAILERQGIESFVVSLYADDGYAHTVCVFMEEGKYNLINQDRLIRCRAGSLEDLASFLHPDWSWGAIAERKGHRGRAIQRIERALL